MSNITIDSHQVFPDLDLTKLDNTICKSDNPNTGLFLNENKHLINNNYLSLNSNDWAVQFLIDNPNYMNIIYFSCNTNDKAIKFIEDNPDLLKRKYINNLD